MKRRRKSLVIAGIAIVIGGLIVAVWWHYRPTESPAQRRARRLIPGLRAHNEQPGMIARWLSDLGIRELPDPRSEWPIWIISEELVAIGREAVPVLACELKGKSRTATYWCLITLGKLGPGAKDAAPQLIATMKHHKEPMYRALAADALGKVAPEPEAAIPALLEALKDEESSVRASAVQALAGVAPLRKANVSIVAEILTKDEAPCVRINAANALGTLAPATEQGVPGAAEALNRAVPALTKALNDPDLDVARAAGDALKKIRAEANAASAPGP